MAKAVVTLEGDSSSLVKSIDNAKGSMQKLEVEGKKLTDQLRDVADEADKAAGALVNKIGGPGAIKAIAAVGAAFAGAQAALGVFSSSMAAYAATQGAAGQKAMADLDTALNELQGQLFTAVIGTDDMAEAMDTVVTVIKAATVVVEAVLTPIALLSTGIRALADNSADATTEQKQLAEAEREAAKATDLTATAVKTLNEKYKSVEGTLVKLLGTEKDYSLFVLKAKSDELLAIVKLDEARQQSRLQIAGDLAAAKAEARVRALAAEEIAEGLADALLGDDTKLNKVNAYLDKVVTAERTAARQIAMNKIIEEEKVSNTEKQRLVEALKLYEQQRKDIESGKTKPEKPTKTGGGTSGDDGKAAREAELAEADATIARITASREAQMQYEEELLLKYGRRSAGMTHQQQVEEAQAYKDIADKKQAEALARLKETEAAEKTRIQATAEFEKAFDDAKKARDDAKAVEDAAREKSKMDALTAGFQEYGKLAGDQLAAGEKASVVAEKLAKKALGAQISALGDKAMVEAAIYAAAFNPMAIPMAAAGVAAYTAAAALGAEGKKATTATPAAAAPAAGPVNTAFNLRVDAAFADGESIARQFAMMQQAAQRRGLVPVGA